MEPEFESTIGTSDEKIVDPMEIVTPRLYLASKSKEKVQAVLNAFDTLNIQDIQLFSLKTSTTIEQPIGKEQIRNCCLERLNKCRKRPVIALETGIVHIEDTKSAYDVTLSILRLPSGDIECWSSPFWFNEKAYEKFVEYLQTNKTITFGQYAYPENKKDWYCETFYSGQQHPNFVKKFRTEFMQEPVIYLLERLKIEYEIIKNNSLPTKYFDFKGVSFLDFQYTMLNHSSTLTTQMKRLASGLLYDYVIVISSRGYLLCGEFAKQNCKIVMATKPGKLPGEIVSKSYQKEYEKDTLCIRKDIIPHGSNVLIIDDVVATGGSMRCIIDMVEEDFKSNVAGVICAYALIYSDTFDLMTKDEKVLKYLRYVQPSYGNMPIIVEYPQMVTKTNRYNNIVLLCPPSYMNTTKSKRMKEQIPCVDVKWNRYERSANITFNSKQLEQKYVVVIVDPSNEEESKVMIDFINILHTKDILGYTVVVPFIEHATQDRVEYFGEQYQTLAMVDTTARTLRTNRPRIVFFDIHAEQSTFTFDNWRELSLMKELLRCYNTEFDPSDNGNIVYVFPDEGAKKRFQRYLPNNAKTVAFGKVRDGDKRYVHTNDTIYPELRHVIIDDIARTCGTAHTTAKYLKEKGVQFVDFLVPHAAFGSSACSRLKIFDQVWTSDSCGNNVPSEFVRVHWIDVFWEYFKGLYEHFGESALYYLQEIVSRS